MLTEPGHRVFEKAGTGRATVLQTALADAQIEQRVLLGRLGFSRFGLPPDAEIVTPPTHCPELWR